MTEAADTEGEAGPDRPTPDAATGNTHPAAADRAEHDPDAGATEPAAADHTEHDPGPDAGPAAADPTEDDLGPYVPAPPASGPDRPRRGAKVAVAAGLAVALVAGVLALANLTSSGGTATPEDAVRKLVDAVAAKDMLGALEALVPAEREVLRDRVVDLAGELGRLGILDDKIDLGQVPGADIAVGP